MIKVALITGTRKGIGKELVKYYLKKSFIVAGCSRKAASIKHKNYIHYSLDVADERAVIKMVRDVAKKYRKIDVLINNVGVASMNHIMLTPYKVVKNIFNTNFLGTFLFIREVSKVMMKIKYGRIINFSTIAVPLKLEGEAIYAASKSAVEILTQISAKELGEFGITVNAIGPAPILTDLIKNIPNKKLDALMESQTIQRFSKVKDIVNIIDFFIDKKSDFITGQVIYLGGIND